MVRWGGPEYKATTATTWSYMPLLDIRWSLRLHYFLERNFSPCTNHIAENTICVCNTGKSCLLLHDDTALFWCVNFSTMHTASYEFLMKPKESARCHHTLSSWVGSGYETSHTRLALTHVLYQGIVRACIYGDYYRWNQLGPGWEWTPNFNVKWESDQCVINTL